MLSEAARKLLEADAALKIEDARERARAVVAFKQDEV